MLSLRDFCDLHKDQSPKGIPSRSAWMSSSKLSSMWVDWYFWWQAPFSKFKVFHACYRRQTRPQWRLQTRTEKLMLLGEVPHTSLLSRAGGFWSGLRRPWMPRTRWPYLQLLLWDKQTTLFQASVDFKQARNQNAWHSVTMYVHNLRKLLWHIRLRIASSC